MIPLKQEPKSHPVVMDEAGYEHLQNYINELKKEKQGLQQQMGQGIQGLGEEIYNPFAGQTVDGVERTPANSSIRQF